MNTRWILAALALLPLLLCSCEDRMKGDETPAATAHLRIAHFAAGIREAQIWLDDDMIATSLDYPALSERLDIPAGIHYIRVAEVMEPPTTQLNESFAVSADSFYTLVIADSEGYCRKLLLKDTTAAAETPYASVRFVHVANAPSLKMWFNRCEPIWGPVGFRQVVTYDTSQCGGELFVQSPGVDSVGLSIPNFALTAGRAYTLYAAGHADGDSITALRVITVQDWP